MVKVKHLTRKIINHNIKLGRLSILRPSLYTIDVESIISATS